MLAKLEGLRIVDNEPFSGKYEVTITQEGCGKTTSTVKAIDELKESRLKEAINESFQRGAILAAYRFGEKGLCAVQINRELMEVTYMTKTGRNYHVHRSGDEFYQTEFLNTDRLVIDGKLRHNPLLEKVHIEIDFKHSI